LAPSKKLDKGAKITFVPNDLYAVVQHRVGEVLGGYDEEIALSAMEVKHHGLHPHTVAEELKTLANRHLMETPPPRLKSKAWRKLKLCMQAIAHEVGPCNITPIRVIVKGKASRARGRYISGYYDYRENGLQWYHSRVTAMQKLELHDVTKLASKEDRAIQYRSVAFNAALARYLWDFEQKLFHGTTYNGLPWCAKGFDKGQRAILLLRMADKYKNPIFVLADHHRFDAHVNEELLKLGHKGYMTAHPNRYTLKQLLKCQCHNVGRSKGGICYFCRGKRMSGDVDTALGNTYINYGMLRTWLEENGIDGNILLDGDDSIVVMEDTEANKVSGLAKYMLNFGMVTEVEVTDDISKAEFCQSRVVLGTNGPAFTPNPTKVLDMVRRSAMRLTVNAKHEVLRSSIICEAISNPGMPMIKPLIKWVEENPGRSQIPSWLTYRLNSGYGISQELVNQGVKWLAPTTAIRTSFWKSWGITPQDQELFEDNVRFTATKGGKPQKFREAEPVDLPPPDCDESEPEGHDDHKLQFRWVDVDQCDRTKWINLLTSC